MEGLRGAAVFLVFLVHYVTESRASGAIAEGLHTIGNTGVDLFFVLSGYLIYGNLIAKPQPFIRFMWRRLRRLYPAFTTVFVIYLALSVARPDLSKIPSEGTAQYLIANYLMLPGILPITPMISVAWSLSYEILYYLVIPVVIVALGLRSRTARWRIQLFLLSAAALLAWCYFHGGHVRLVMFIAGVLIYEMKSAPRDSLAALAVAAAFAAMLIHTFGSAGYALKVAGLFVGFGALCSACFARPQGALGSLFSWTPLRWLGNMSYSYYLVHGLALKAAFMVLGHGPFWAMLPVMFVITLIPGALLFLFVERPLSLTARPRPRVALVST